MKDFKKFRENLGEEVETVEEGLGVALPPNILILRRQSIRHFPGQTLVALYYNDKLDQYFSIPFGGEDNLITPTSMKEDTEQLDEVNLGKKDHEVIKAFIEKRPHSSKKLSTDGKRLDGNWLGGSKISHHEGGEILHNDVGSKSGHQVHRAVDKHSGIKNKLNEEILEEDAIAHLRSVKDFHSAKALKHKDGTQTKVDPTTAHALLTVHDALSDEHKAKFKDQLEKSKGHFHRMVDFAWKNVK